ncbi:MAG: hypothetical protein RID09_20755 [Coleofasciculus sp. G1-WW12-02]|uniref:WD40/YVTN/BNR-like repeat-containing protein n=1 Tax=Coleofasciculus sp. G1-WW12-02 TaxID=3068483 RepID=UPI0032FABBA6
MKKILGIFIKEFRFICQSICFLLLLIVSVLWIHTDVAHAHRPHDDVYHVELSPTYSQDQTLFITVRGNLLKSTDGGESWQRAWKGLNNRANLFAVSVFPENPKTLFVSSLGNGIYKSQNQGVSWTQVNQGLDNLSIDLLSISPQSPDIVLAAGEEKGLYKTKDGGENWYSVINSDAKITALGFSPAQTNQVFVGDTQGIVYLSQDAGETWKQMSTLAESGSITALAFSPNFATDNTVWIGTEKEGIFKTEDSGASFSNVNQGLSDPSIRDITIVSNGEKDITLWAATWDDGVFYSQDGGTVWQKSSKGLTKSPQADERQFSKPHFNDLEFSNTFSQDKTVFLAGFNGIFKSNDGGKVWQELDALSARLIVGLAISPDYANDSTIAVVNYVGEAYISQDQGVTWQPMKKGLEIPRFTQSFEEPLDDPRRYFDIGFSSNYKSDNTLFLGLLRDYFVKSTDQGNHWEIVNLKRVPGKFVRGTIIAVSPNFAVDQTLYLSTNQGTIYQSTDAGSSFSILQNLDYRVTAFVISPNFASDKTLYASGFDGVFKSVDAGKTWQKTTNNIDSMEKSWLELAISPNYAVDKTLIAGTNQGLFKTQDGGKTWIKFAGTTYGEDGYIEAVALSPNYANDQTFMITVRGKGTFQTVNDGETFTQIDDKLYLARVDNVPSASVPIKFSPAYAVDQTIYGFGSVAAKVFKSTDAGNTWETMAIPSQDYGYNPFTFLSLALYVHSTNLLKIIVAGVIAVITYFLTGKLGLEKKLPLSKLQIKAVSSFLVFVVCLLLIKILL